MTPNLESQIFWNMVTAVAGIVIALAAVIATVWQGVITRKHNRLSVTPRLRVDMATLPDDRCEIVLHSVGIGPAIIGRAMLRFSGEDWVDSTEDRWDTLVSSKFRPSVHVSFNRPLPGDTYMPGEKLDMFSFDTTTLKEKEYLAARTTLKDVEIRIDYSSIYGECAVLRFGKDERALKTTIKP